MQRKRIFILDEITDSCRLMPTWVQSTFFFIFLGISMLIVPVMSYFFLGTIMMVQVVFILLLVKKNIVYRSISKMEIAVQKKVIWLHSKKDEQDKYKKGLVNITLLLITLLLFYKLQSVKLLVINGLFCFLFFLKLAFYVPLISVRIVEEEGQLVVIDKGRGINTEIELYQINSIAIKPRKITIETKKNNIDVPLDFSSNKEVRKLNQFLKQLNEFEVK